MKRFAKLPIDWLTWFLLGFLYFFQRSREPALGDALSFTLAAIDGFDWSTNATNHFLYINFLHLLTLILPFAKAHFLFVMVSILGALATLFYVLQILKLLHVSGFYRAMVLAVLGLSFTFWRHAEIVEVYTINLAITALVVFWFVKWNIDKRDLWLYISSAVLGIAMLVHVQQVLYLPFLAIWYYWAFSFEIKKWLIGALLFLIPASILIWPVLLWQTNSYSSILFDNSFQDEVLGFDALVLAKGMAKALFFLLFNFGFFALFMVVALWRKVLLKKMNIGLGFLALVVFVFAARYNVSDNYVFFLPSYLVLTVFLGVYFQQFSKEYKLKKGVLVLLLLPTLLLYHVGPVLLQKVAAGQTLHNEKWYKGGLYFFIEPGMQNKPSALDVARWLEEGKLAPKENLEIEQNAENALRYLHQNHNKPH